MFSPDQYGGVLTTRQTAFQGNTLAIYTQNDAVYYQVLTVTPARYYICDPGVSTPTPNWIHVVFTFTTANGKKKLFYGSSFTALYTRFKNNVITAKKKKKKRTVKKYWVCWLSIFGTIRHCPNRSEIGHCTSNVPLKQS